MLKIFIISSLMLLINSCLSIDNDKRGLSLKIKMISLEEKLNKSFPIKENIKVGTLEIINPHFIGKNKNKDKIDLEISFNFSNFLIPKGINGKVKISTGIYYNSKSYKIYLKDPMIDEFKIANFTLSKFLTPNIKNIISNMVIREIIKYPIYDLNKESKLYYSYKFIRKISIEDSNIILSFGF